MQFVNLALKLKFINDNFNNNNNNNKYSIPLSKSYEFKNLFSYLRNTF